MRSNTDVKPVKPFRENDQGPQFLFSLGLKWPPNWASQAHIPHTSKISYNEQKEQYWCETSRAFFRKWPKTLI